MTSEILRLDRLSKEGTPQYLDGIWDFNPIGIDLRMAVTDWMKLPEIRSKMVRLNGKYPVREKVFAGKIYLVSARDEDFEIFERPHPSWSKNHGSEAYYLFRSRNGRILGQIMLPYSRSSEHEHDGTEEYNQVSGRLMVRSNHDIQVIDTQNPRLKLPEGVFHQVHTFQETSVSVIICNFNEHRYK